jgi:dTDP-glucose 4,6-dehydratase
LKIVVTGGAGFIGSHFARRLLTDPLNSYEVFVIDSLTYAGNLRNIEDLSGYANFRFIKSDICDPELPDEIFLHANSIVNFAAESHVDRSISSSAAFVKTNIEGTHNLLTKALEYNVPKFLQISTDEVYGSISEGSWDENFPLSPNSPYAASKASADLLVRSFNKTHGLHTNITRCSNNFGTHQFPEKLIPVIINSLIQGNKIPIYGNGLNKRDWLSVEDHCRGIELVMNKGKSGEIYNIGGGTELTNLDLAKIIIRVFGKQEDLLTFVPDRKGHDSRYSVTYDKISSELGYKPKDEFVEKIQDVINWYLSYPDWWHKP